MIGNMSRYKLRDLLSIQNGKDYRNLNHGDIPVYGTGGIIAHVNAFLSDRESILLPRKGTLNNIMYVSGKFWTVDTMYWTKINEDLAYPKYLFYYLSLLDLSARDSGSTLPSMTFESYYTLDIDLPPLEKQKDIADRIFKINQNIENNHSIINNLESLAKTLYDYWFLQFEFPNEEGKPYKSSGGKMVWCEELKREIPEGWDHGSLYDIADFVNGLACQKYRPIDSSAKLPVIKIGEMHSGIGKDVEWARNDVPQKYIISDGDILFSWSATLETMIWASGEGVLNQHIFKVNPKKANKYYVYQQLKSYVINFIRMAETRKTTMGHITTDHLKQSRIVIPPSSIIEKYEEQVCDMFQKYIECSKENRELSSLRDFLLPMLMNGQVTFKDN